MQRAANDGDIDALHDEVCRLRNTLVERTHILASTGSAPDLQDRLIRHGHERLLRFLDEILSNTHDGAGSCTCLVRGAELRSLLVRQLRLEANVARAAADPPRREGEDR
ncbi:MAG: hypothetical protein ACLGIC_04140 [Acidimicrobiia bacterium]